MIHDYFYGQTIMITGENQNEYSKRLYFQFLRLVFIEYFNKLRS